MKIQSAIFAAATLGTIAFNNGAPAIPVHDKQFMGLLRENEGRTLLLLKAWNKAWHDANLSN